MNFDSALERALDGDSILFLGAGFSLGATNSRGAQFKSGGDFAAHLSSMVHLPPTTELQDAAEALLQKAGPTALANELMNEFRATQVAKHHVSVAQVPWRRVYTTNYDTVFELASSLAKNVFRPVTLSDRPRDFEETERLCIHFNGYVERLTSTGGDEIRLTDGSYLTTSVEASPWAGLFRLDLARAKSVFFVGYSLADLDITRLLSPTEDLGLKTFFVVGPKPTPRTESRATRYGTLQHFDAAWFAKQLQTKRTRYTPPERSGPSWYCLEPYAGSLGGLAVGLDKAIFDLFLRGLIDRNLLSTSLHEGDQSYLLERRPVRNILNVCRDASKLVVVHSGLGNGKSMVAESIKAIASSDGLPVYSLNRRSPSINDELSWLASADEQFLLAIDGYPAWLDALELLGTHRNRRMCLLLTSRTAPHDVLIDRLEEIFYDRVIYEFNVDKLEESDLESISDVFQQYGLWGTKASLSKENKLRHLRSRCRSEWQAILTDLFEAPQIQVRFDEVLKKLDDKSGFYDIVIGILALTILNEQLTTDMLVDVFGARVLDATFQRNETIAELVDFNKGRVLHRSSVAAQFVLRRVADPNATVDVIATVAQSLAGC